MSQGVTVWFTGLSGSGKTTVAKRVEEILLDRRARVERLDGDVVRQSLTRDLGFSKADRDKNIERVTFVAKLLTRQGVIVLSAFIAPYREARSQSRREIGSFLEVYVKAPLEVLLERDVKGLYRKALAGEIKDFTGVDDPYEEPEQPDLVLETDGESVEESASTVVALLEQRGFVAAGAPPAVPAGPGSAAKLGGPSAPSPIRPHGGTLVERELSGREREEALRGARGLPRVVLDEKSLADLEMIGVGAMSPLTGFMVRQTYLAVLESMRLPDGLVWPVPITLTVSEAQARTLREGQDVLLTDASGHAVAVQRIEEIYSYDKALEAEAVFGTTETAHPGVAALMEQGSHAIGGPVWILDRPGQAEFGAHRLTPAQTRREFARRGWQRVVAFQTRNPVHRAHEYIQKAALEGVDGLLLHPLVGRTKADDVPADIRMRSYQVILDAYYPKERVMLTVFPAAMRYAGPREAIFHALARKNYGCTHFIVGRDHAGVGNYYGTYDAQNIFSRFAPNEIGIEPLRFEHSFYCSRCEGMATAKTCPHDSQHHVVLSGTKVRRMLQQGQLPPREFSRPEVARLLVEAMAVAAAEAGEGG